MPQPGEARISAVDVRDLADVAVAALTGSQHDNKNYSLTGPEGLTFGEMAKELSAALGRTITFVDVPPEAMRGALADLGLRLGKPMVCLKSSRCIVAARLPQSNRESLRPLTEVPAHLANLRATMPRFSLEDGTKQNKGKSNE